MITRTIRGQWVSFLTLILGGHAIVAGADNLPFAPTFTIGTAALVNDNVSANTDGSFRLEGAQQGGTFNGGAVWDLQWDVMVRQDPLIAGFLTLTNLTTTTRTFNISLALPITPAFAPSLYGGSLNATVVDLNGDLSASLAPVSSSAAIYRGTIDGSPVLSLFAMNLTCAGSIAGCSATSSDSFGLPGPTLPGPAVTGNIGTLLSFTLSPGDRVMFESNFTVEPPAAVPLPAALPMLMLSLGGVAAIRRRRRGPQQRRSSASC